MTQKPSVIANFPNIINRADSMIIEFKFNPVFAPLILSDFVISSFLALAAIIFVPNIQLLVILMIIFYGLSFLQYFNSHHLIKKMAL